MAKSVVPSYETVIEDKRQGGHLEEYLRVTPLPEKALGQDILLEQQRLSGPRRRLLTLACSLTLFAGGAVLMESANNEMSQISQQTGVAKAEQVNHLQNDLIAGGLFGALGGLSASFMGLGLSRRLAVKPAMRIVRRGK